MILKQMLPSIFRFPIIHILFVAFIPAPKGIGISAPIHLTVYHKFIILSRGFAKNFNKFIRAHASILTNIVILNLIYINIQYVYI